MLAMDIQSWFRNQTAVTSCTHPREQRYWAVREGGNAGTNVGGDESREVRLVAYKLSRAVKLPQLGGRVPLKKLLPKFLKTE